uniref:HOOK N-terminal domain-containing protein n=1 Tax=Romanomermis culicivorax TaxID=13658 RepID=A0A915K355_ROMCU
MIDWYLLFDWVRNDSFGLGTWSSVKASTYAKPGTGLCPVPGPTAIRSAIASFDNFKQTQQQNLGGPAYYRRLCDGYEINIVLETLINNRNNIYLTNANNGFDTIGRIKNWRRFLHNVLLYYSDVLNQLIVMPLPDLLTIARNPFPEGSGHEMKKVLLLLLGCAVQSEKKEEFINKIKELDVSLQETIVNLIRKVTHDVDCVLNVQALELDPEDQPTTVVLHQLQRVIKERDLYANTILEMGQDQESDCSSSQSMCNGDVCARKLPESLQHVNHGSCETDKELVSNNENGFELADLKAKLRKLRQELDDKNEQLQFYKEDLEDKESKLNNLTVEHRVKATLLIKGYII